MKPEGETKRARELDAVAFARDKRPKKKKAPMLTMKTLKCSTWTAMVRRISHPVRNSIKVTRGATNRLLLDDHR
jgi:hypothetical protein